MKRILLGLIIGFMLIGIRGFAADGDLVVNGKIVVGETSPDTKLTVKTAGQVRDGIKLTQGTDSPFLYFGVNSPEDDYNPLVAAGDKAIIFSDGDIDTGVLVIGPWTDTAKGIKLSLGRVGIGANPPTGYKLYVSGSAYSTGGWLTSDLKYKEGIQPITSALDKVQTIRGS